MLIGVLSDTHGRIGPLHEALRVLREKGVKAYLHCGDIGEHGPRGNPRPVLDKLAGTGCRFVWGNNDEAAPADVAYARDLGLDPLGDRATLNLGGCRIRIEHGDDLRELKRLTTSANGECDLLLTGHSHIAHDRRHGTLRWVNPGALHRASVYTVATVDLARLGEDDAVELHTLTR